MLVPLIIAAMGAVAGLGVGYLLGFRAGENHAAEQTRHRKFIDDSIRIGEDIDALTRKIREANASQ